jgi:hypothetical protein
VEFLLELLSGGSTPEQILADIQTWSVMTSGPFMPMQRG